MKPTLSGIIVAAVLAGYSAPAVPQDTWISGFGRKIAGETISYHSPQHDGTRSLLVRSLAADRGIAWETAPVPAAFSADTALFVWMFGLDVNEDSHRYRLFIDGTETLSFSNPADTAMPAWRIRGHDGITLEFRSVMVDRYGDFMGYAFLKVPSSRVRPGRPLRLDVQGESAGSRTWYMTFEYEMAASITISGEPALLRSERGPMQPLRIEIVHVAPPERATIEAAGELMHADLHLGYNYIQMPVPAVTAPQRIRVRVSSPSHSCLVDAAVRPVKEMTLYLLHHSHVDIGYTHTQAEVAEIQAGHLEQAMDIADASQGYPAGARFKWNSEVMWHVDRYLREESEQNRDRMLRAIRNGSIEIDALYGNQLTGLGRPEELLRLTRAGETAALQAGVELRAAMISDVPGWSWGLVASLAGAGVRYLALGTNAGHRIGSVIETWGDRPFYWVSPSGRDSVLCWIAGKGYSWFHTGLGSVTAARRLAAKPVLDYLEQLSGTYPYDMLPFHYNIGSDNGPPDPGLPDKVRTWNETYISPRIIISTVSEAFAAFETRYGGALPAVSGDFTGYWEDGAASSARETALVRQAEERLTQAEIIWALSGRGDFPSGLCDEAWRQAMLYNEHTWGSWNSISAPDDPFTLSQWAVKQSFALAADSLSRELLALAEGRRGQRDRPARGVTVINTNSWRRRDLVFLEAASAPAGDRVVDSAGNPVPSQRLSDGRLAMLTDVAPLAAQRYEIREGAPFSSGAVRADRRGLYSDHIRLLLDERTGAVKSLSVDGYAYVSEESMHPHALNEYLYVAGRDPSVVETVTDPHVEVLDSGPLTAALRITSGAPGCSLLVREVRLTAGLDRIDFRTVIHKREVRDPEAVHLSFTCDVPDPRVRMDGAWCWFEPESGQVPGACKNYYSVQRWVDISNQDRGVTLTLPDAPLVEMGGLHADPVVCGWIDSAVSSGRIYSYVMNNYWETNYRAYQAGEVVLRYSLYPHRGFDAVAAKKRGLDASRPLLAVPDFSDFSGFQEEVTVSNSRVIVTSMERDRHTGSLAVRLMYPGEGTALTEIAVKGGPAVSVRLTSFETRTVLL
ncbi:hypothetical protein JXO52_03680 [bacterium]|nr:hypothetical protein [bacterium]